MFLLSFDYGLSESLSFFSACLNSFVRLFFGHRDLRLALLTRALFGPDTWRFAAMLGTFVSTYKFLLNALPLFIPAINPRSTMILHKSKTTSAFADDDSADPESKLVLEINEDLESGLRFSRTENATLEVPVPSTPNRRAARVSLSTHAQLVLIRKKTRRWHAALAGALAGGMSIMWEKKGRRTVIAQQMFVR